MQAFGRCSFLRKEVCLIKFSFKWRSKYFIWKLICSANFWHLEFCLVKDLRNCLIFLLIVSIWEHNHLATMWQLKNRCPLSAPLRAYFSFPQLPKKPFGESWHQTAFTDFLYFWKSLYQMMSTISISNFIKS